MNTFVRFLVILLLPFFSLHAKVYDCFPFFNEIELLKLRLEELDPSVDYFVIVESIETQRGDPKPLYFQENRHLFEKYLPKIIHVVVDERHPEMPLWTREHYQRNCILRGLKNCEPRDVIIISDLDEIPRSSVVKQVSTLLSSGKKVSFAKPTPFDNPYNKKKYEKKCNRLEAYSLQMDIYYYHLNRQTPNREIWGGGKWYGTIITTYETLSRKCPQYFRNKRNFFRRIDKGGWHFTWMGGKNKVRQKLLSVVEGRSDANQITDEEIEQWLENHPPVPVDDTFPQYVRKNKEYLTSIDFLCEEKKQVKSE